MYRILVLATIAYILGILTITTHVLVFSLIFVGGLIFYSLLYLTESPYRPVITLLLITLSFCFGIIRTGRESYRINQLPPELGQNITLIAQICEEPQKHPNRYLYVTRLKNSRYEGKILISVAGQELLPYRYGDVIQVKGKLELPSRAKNPGEFDYREYLKRQGITVQINILPKDISLVNKGTLNPLIHGAIWAKGRVQENINELLPAAEADLFNSVFFGGKGLLTGYQKNIFSQLGIMHVFAVSGFHVGLVLVVLLGLAILLKLKGFWRNMLLLLGMTFYAFLTGLTPSVLRATIMAGGIIFAEWFWRERDFYTALASSALLLLVYNPYNLFESGFQLSYVVTWGMVYFQPYFEKLFSFLPSWRTYLIVAISSQLAALPLTAYYFNIISVAALIINLIVVPVMGVVVNLGMFVFILTFLWAPLARPFIYSAGIIITLMLKFLIWASNLPGIALKVATPSIILIILSYLSLILMVEFQKSKKLKLKFIQPVAGVICVGILACYLIPPPLHGKLEITFIDVGQGDAIFVQTPEGQRFLIDGGGTNFTGTFNAGESTVVPYLTRRGVFKLDGVINTHPDTDHLAGLLPVVEEVAVATAITPPPQFFENGYAEWEQVLLEQDIPWKIGLTGETLLLDKSKIKLEILHPGKKTGYIPA
jgi:competence protein ComEC